MVDYVNYIPTRLQGAVTCYFIAVGVIINLFIEPVHLR